MKAVVAASRAGVGWMRQIAGVAWRAADPVGYLDDDRMIALHAGHDGFAGESD